MGPRQRSLRNLRPINVSTDGKPVRVHAWADDTRSRYHTSINNNFDQQQLRAQFRRDTRSQRISVVYASPCSAQDESDFTHCTENQFHAGRPDDDPEVQMLRLRANCCSSPQLSGNAASSAELDAFSKRTILVWAALLALAFSIVWLSGHLIQQLD